MAKSVSEVSRPFLTQNNLNAFSYSRIYKDGSRTELWSDALALEHTFFTKKYIVGAYTPDYFYEKEQYAILQIKVLEYPDILRRKYIQQLIDQREYFNHDHPFIIVNKNQNYSEYFIYYAPINARCSLNFYINSLDLLKKFSAQFTVAAADLIKVADLNRIATSCVSICSHLNTSEISTNTNFLLRSDRLTKREIDVANQLVSGKTADEIGISLHISRRTVESHLENLKFKLGCRKKSELINALLKNRIVNFK
jgi:DNA-binding CsgD family transcriptional regulator